METGVTPGQSRLAGTLVFLHDAWLGPSSWETFAGYFTGRGYDTLAPEWPVSHADGAARGNRNTTSSITDIVDSYDDMIRAMSNPPVIVGHGFGGLFTQLLLDRGVGAAGVAISPVPPTGTPGAGVVALRWGARALIRNPRRRSTATLTFRQFNQAFTNTWPADAARAAYERYSAPTPEQVIIDRALARLRWRRASAFTYSYDDRAPLLIIAAENDALVPPSVVARNCQRYSSLAETDFADFPGRSHLVMLEHGWQEIADYVSGWLMRRSVLPSVS
jgi:pimeloyl-ACP methyl ester carboxylesterase